MVNAAQDTITAADFPLEYDEDPADHVVVSVLSPNGGWMDYKRETAEDAARFARTGLYRVSDYNGPKVYDTFRLSANFGAGPTMVVANSELQRKA